MGGLCKLVYDLRLVAITLTILSLSSADDAGAWLVAALLLACLASFAPLMWWSRLGPVLMRHPAYLAADALFAAFVLMVAGTDSPFFYFTLGTALLAGLLYGWRGAVVLSALLVSAAWWVYRLRRPEVSGLSAFQELVGLPALYPIFAAAAAEVRRLLEVQAATNTALGEATRLSAAAEERARLAREMHDSVTKSLHGIALAATALAGTVARRPEQAEEGARALAAAARQAAAEARSLVVDLRADHPDEPFEAAVRRVVLAWARETGTTAEVAAEPVELGCADVRHELLCVLKEALANIALHADARRVRVGLTRREGQVVLTVADDGAGFAAPGQRDLADLAEAGHFGLVGMQERAARVGGRLLVTSAPGQGTTVTATVPRAGEARRSGVAPDAVRSAP